MNRRDLFFTLLSLIFAVTILGVAVGSARQQVASQAGEKPRCPCVDPTPDRAAMSPARYVGEYGLHVCAFHIGKDDANLQVESHHYCTPLRDGVFQCTIYDSDRANPKLIGVEYIVSEEIFKTLPAEEKKYWHPHEHEIRTGLLTMPGLQPDCEKKLVKGLLKTWGKVWQTWPDPKTDLPIGPPVLMWSSVKDGDVRKELIKKRDEFYKIDGEDVRKQRAKILADR